MLADDDAVRAAIVSRDVLRTAPKDLVHIVMCTLSVAFARELEQAHAEAGIAYIAAQSWVGRTPRPPALRRWAQIWARWPPRSPVQISISPI
jgi:hypothetical protein